MLKEKYKFPLAIIFTFYAAGIILACFISLPIFVWIFLLTSGLAFEIFILKNHKEPCLLILFVFLGGLNYSVNNSYLNPHIINHTKGKQPSRLKGKVIQTEYYQDESCQVILGNLRIKNNSWQKVNGKLIIHIQNYEMRYIYGDFLEFSTIITEPDLPRNPGQFNYRKYLFDRNIYATSWIEMSSEVNRVTPSNFSLLRSIDVVKQKILSLIDKTTESEIAPIVKALITGVRGDISAGTEQMFIDSGVLHILAVSGLHVGYVTLIFLLLFGFLRIPLKSKYLMTIVALWLFAAMVQFKPSVVRAVTMASCILFGKILERPNNIYNALGFAALLQILILPNQLFDVGFQLSFTAVFSIIYIYDKLLILLPAKLAPKNITRKPFRYIYQLFLISLAAQIGTLPITIYYFNRIPIVAVFVNLFAIPLVGLIAALGFSLVLLGFVWIGFGYAYGEVVNILVLLLKTIINFCADLPFAYIEYKQVSIITVFIIYTFIYFLLNFQKRKMRVYFAIFILLLSNIRIWTKVIKQPDMKILFFDVGQGDAAYVELPDGSNLLIDCGVRGFHRNYARDVISPYLKKQGVDKINILIISHPHNDHIGGAPYILRNFNVGQIWETDIVSKSKVFGEVHHLLDSLDTKIKKNLAGNVINLGNNSYIEILHPSRKFIEAGEPNFNNASLCFKLNYDRIDILFTGDIEKKGQNYLCLYEDYLDSEIIKVPHHGSATSSGRTFISKVSPDYALISVGQRNKFGHPDVRIINRYKKMGSDVHRTDYEGALLLKINGKKIQEIDWQ